MTIIDTSDGYREPLPTGYQEPFDQILSDDELAPVHAPRLHERWDNTNKWRLFEREGWWYAIQPHQIDEPLFKHLGWSYGYASRDGRAALQMLQLAMAKAAA